MSFAGIIERVETSYRWKCAEREMARTEDSIANVIPSSTTSYNSCELANLFTFELADNFFDKFINKHYDPT